MYASRIAVYYGIVIFVYFLTFKNTYSLPIIIKKYRDERDKKKKSTDETGRNPAKGKSDDSANALVVALGIILVFVMGVLLSGFHGMNAVFIYYIPINHSIEESVNGVQMIYNGAAILIGGLIAYNVGWFYYHSRNFSVESALQKAVEDFEKDPFSNDEENWKNLTEEDRMTEIIKALLLHEAKSRMSSTVQTMTA